MKLRSRTPIFKTILICAACLALQACATRTIIVQPGTVFKTGKELKGVSVFVPDKDGNLIEATGDIPAGASVVIPPNNIVKLKPPAGGTTTLEYKGDPIIEPAPK